MATAYKYQERDLDSQVNYADIGLGLSNLVTDQLATRKAKKEAYDDQVRAFNQYLDENPKGDDVNMTEWTASYASQMQQQMLANQRAFKNGQVSERDNIVFMQNVQNGTKIVFDLSADYQAEYADKMERLKSTDPKNKSQLIETWLMQNAEGYGNFKNAKPIIDPKTGLVLMSVKQKDGTYQTASAANLQTRIKAKYDYFDTDAVATDIEAGIGEEITSTLIAANRSRGGQITEVEDKKLKDGFKDALTLQLNSYLENPLATSSILTNTLKKYTPTFSKEEAAKDPTKILMVTVPGGNGTPMPDFSTENGKKQQAEALDYMYKQVIQKIDVKVKQQEIGKYQDRALGSSGGGGGDKVNTTAVTLWDQLRWGTVEEKNQAAQSLVQMKFDDGLIGINFDKRGNIELEYDPASGFTDNTVTLRDKTPLEWAQTGIEVHGVKDMNKVAEVAATSFNRPYRSIGKYVNGKLTNPNDFTKAGHRRNIDK